MLLLSADDRRTVRRLRLAEGLERAVQRAHQSPWDLSAQVPVARESVLGSEERLLRLAAVLRSPSDLPAAGLGAVRALLTDGAGPLFLAERDLCAALGRVERHLGLA